MGMEGEDVADMGTRAKGSMGKLATGLDNDTKEPSYATEAIFEAAWTSAEKTADHPLGYARSAPFDFLDGTGPDADGGAAYLAQLLAARVVADSEAVAQTTAPRLVTGAPECEQFIERFLPGEVNRHPWDNMPTNAKRWDREWAEYSDGPTAYVELARRHPGDAAADDADTDGNDYDRRAYAPLTTKAGSRVFSVSFVAPGGAAATLRACYPLQLLVRVDAGRGLLVYDCFDFVPVLAGAFDAARDISPVELASIEKALKRGRRQRAKIFGAFSGMFGAAMGAAAAADEPAPRDTTHAERCAHYGASTLRAQANWQRWRASTLACARSARARHRRAAHRPRRGAPARGPRARRRGLPLSHLGRRGEGAEDDDDDGDDDDDDDDSDVSAEGPRARRRGVRRRSRAARNARARARARRGRRRVVRARRALADEEAGARAPRVRRLDAG